MDKLWYIQTMEYYSVLQRNELSGHENTWRNPKCILVSEGGQSEKVIYSMILVCMIPIYDIPEKAKLWRQ